MDKSLHWYLRRHPLLYQIRYSLVSKKVGVSRIENFCYNTINKKKDIPFLIDLKTEKQEVNLTNFNKKKQLDENHVRDLYFNPNSFPFLITHYCNKTYDTFLDTFEFLPESIIHGLVYLTGQSYLYEFPITTTNKTLS